MKKVIKILVVVVIVGGLALVWFKNPGDIQSKVLRTKAQAQKAAGNISNIGKITPEDIQKAKQCRDNLQRIQSAKISAQQRKAVGQDVTWEEILPIMNLKDIPRCPCGGNYRINPALQVPSCSIGTNGSVDTSDDHMIYH